MIVFKPEPSMEYFELLEQFDSEKMPTIKAFHSQQPKLVAIRHDIDQSLVHATKFAEQEAAHGITGTYFLLHSHKYFDYSNRLVEQCKALEGMGHEIGLHNDVLTEWLLAGRNSHTTLIQHLSRPLEFLRSNGIQVYGTSSHGNQMCPRANYRNHEIWDRNPFIRKNNFPISPIEMSSFDLEYEAGFDREHHLSDSGGKWTCRINGKIIKKQDEARKVAIEEFNKANHCKLQLLIHPCHWWVH